MTKETFESIVSYFNATIKNTRYENHVFFVGGCIRDFLMGEDIHDIDIVVDLARGGIEFAEFITQREKCYKYDSNPKIFNRYGVASFRLTTKEEFKDISFECVQTRRNANYTLPETAKLEDNLGTILEDARLRDLTINSMYLDVSDKSVLDPLNGVDSISGHVLETTNSSDVIFRDDPIRMMRIIRFASKYNWNIEAKTWLGILKHHELIKNVPIERVSSELNNILLTEKPSIGLKRLLFSGILYDVFPQLYGLNRLCREYSHMEENIWEHTLKVVDNSQPILINRLGALFHDIGKLMTIKIIKGRVRFYGHECCGVNLVKDILTKLKYPEHVIKDVQNVVKNHMTFSMVTGTYTPSRKVLRKFLAEVGDKKELVLDVIRADFLAQNPTRLVSFNRIKEALSDVEKEEDYSNITLPVNGKDIMDYLKISGGPVVGIILDLIRDAKLENPTLTRAEAFAIADRHISVTV